MLTDRLTRYDAAVEHGEVRHEPSPSGMWVMFDDVVGLLQPGVAGPVGSMGADRLLDAVAQERACVNHGLDEFRGF